MRGLNVRPFVRSQTPASSHTSQRVHLLNVQGSVWDKPIDRIWILLSTFLPPPPSLSLSLSLGQTYWSYLDFTLYVTPPPPLSLSLWDKLIDRTWILLSTSPPPSLSLFGTNLLIVPGFYSLRPPSPSLWDKSLSHSLAWTSCLTGFWLDLDYSFCKMGVSSSNSSEVFEWLPLQWLAIWDLLYTPAELRPVLPTTCESDFFFSFAISLTALYEDKHWMLLLSFPRLVIWTDQMF